MTPFAHRIVGDYVESLAGGKPRRFGVIDGTFQRVGEDRAIAQALPLSRCFEISGIRDAVADLVERTARQDADGRVHIGTPEDLAFPPAPSFWLEWRAPECAPKGRMGVLLMQEQALARAVGALCFAQDDVTMGDAGMFAMPLRGTPEFGSFIGIDPRFDPGVLEVFAAFVYGALSFINTPRITDQREHAAHRGLARRLSRITKAQGASPLLPWTEIVLKAGSPPAGTGGLVNAYVGGQRPLHFCRSYVRLRGGRMELVKSHWRGEAALGVAPARYRVEA